MKFRKYVAEFIGTGVLVLMGCGAAVFLGTATTEGFLAVALAFGLAIVAMFHVIGNVSGCHINPAVSLGMLIAKKISFGDFIAYVIAQLTGALVGALLLRYITNLLPAADFARSALFSNTAVNVGTFGAIIIELILAFIFVFTFIGVTDDPEKNSVAGLVTGLTFTLVYIFGIPLTGASVNPARSFGPAILARTDAFVARHPATDLWIFLLAPLLGAALAAIVWQAIKREHREHGYETAHAHHGGHIHTGHTAHAVKGAQTTSHGDAKGKS